MTAFLQGKTICVRGREQVHTQKENHDGYRSCLTRYAITSCHMGKGRCLCRHTQNHKQKHKQDCLDKDCCDGRWVMCPADEFPFGSCAAIFLSCMYMLMTAYAKSLIVNRDGTVLAGGERSSVFHNNGMSAYANCWNDLESNGTVCLVSPFGHTWHQPLSTRILKPLVGAEGRHSALIPKFLVGNRLRRRWKGLFQPWVAVHGSRRTRKINHLF